MILRRWMAAVLALAMIVGCGFAEEAAPLPEPAYANLAPEEIRAFVEQMFAAACGTTVEMEKELRKAMPEEEIALRNAANAEYRAKTLAWLTETFNPEPEIEEILTEETPAPDAVPGEEMPIVYTADDAFTTFPLTEAGIEYLKLLEALGGTDAQTCLQISREICKMWMDEIDHAGLKQMNDDYRCWIYAPATQIDYPVVQHEDNNHYLKRLFNGNRNSAGTLFIDCRNLEDFQDPNTLIYGHHMRNDSMFGTLTDYASQAYYEGHPFILMLSEKEIFILEIFAGYTTSDGDHCYDIAISDEEDMKAFLEEAMRKSDFESGVAVQTKDHLVTLSTCAYAFKDARYILIGRIVPVWQAEDMDIVEEEEIILAEEMQ